MQKYNKRLGIWGEKLAEDYLASLGYRILERHWQKREGEIDIVAYDKKTQYLVFVEVKTRVSDKFGRVDESIDQNKQRKFASIIERYIVERNYKGDYRGDVIFVKKGIKVTLDHLKNVLLE